MKILIHIIREAGDGRRETKEVLSLLPHAKKCKARSDLDRHRRFDVAHPGNTWGSYETDRIGVINYRMECDYRNDTTAK